MFASSTVSVNSVIRSQVPWSENNFIPCDEDFRPGENTFDEATRTANPCDLVDYVLRKVTGRVFDENLFVTYQNDARGATLGMSQFHETVCQNLGIFGVFPFKSANLTVTPQSFPQVEFPIINAEL